MFFLVSLDFILVFYKEIDVVQPVHQTMLLVGIDFEGFRLACRLVGNGLGRKVYFYFRLRVGKDRVEQFFQEPFAYHHRKHEIIQFVILVDIGKETGYYYTEAVTGNRPRRMKP